MIYPVILSGGSGTRLWPMSRSLYPKQLLALFGETSLLQQTVRRAAEAAKSGLLVTFGITPDRAETGYGYIAGGKPIAACEGALAVARFIENPEAEQAERYVAAGDHFWNSGIFLFPAAVYLAELE